MNKQALREAAERAMHDDWGYDTDIFHEQVTPSVVLALLDECAALAAENAGLKSALNDILQPDAAVLERNHRARALDAMETPAPTLSWLKCGRRVWRCSPKNSAVAL